MESITNQNVGVKSLKVKSIKDIIVKESLGRIRQQTDPKLQNQQIQIEMNMLISSIHHKTVVPPIEELDLFVDKINAFVFACKSIAIGDIGFTSNRTGQDIIMQMYKIDVDSKITENVVGEINEIPPSIHILIDDGSETGLKIPYSGVDESGFIVCAATKNVYNIREETIGKFIEQIHPTRVKVIENE